ncbi:atrial natriuretic peptide-converting enzyme-like [Phymastichus coffea]|uniref:atrial natriuretic peptide-converting enzyme-like n=1 Tax=Phymastichus coffea TaxID=108790 RepID=UPI00273BD57E|nr:atrial natriuretic peptide-converting enzyme-like [Phymastichus coffea]
MYQTIYFYIIQQLLLFTARVEPLSGQEIVAANNLDISFMASIQNTTGYHICSGVLVTFQYVLTILNCLQGKPVNYFRIAFGMTDLQHLLPCGINAWYSYYTWAAGQNLSDIRDENDIALIKLSIEPMNGVPIRLTQWNKQQLQGKTAMILGWTRLQNSDQLTKGIVNILKDEDCSKMMNRITNRNHTISSKIICTFAEPYVLLEKRDVGGPLLDQDGNLLGINLYSGPRSYLSWGDFTNDFIQKYQVNHHSALTYLNFQRFIRHISMHY